MRERVWSVAAVLPILWALGCSRATPVEEISVDAGRPVEDLPAAAVGADDWPWWRGPQGNGIAAADPVPVTWDESQNVVWKASVPGRGHSSPTVVGDRIFLTTADEEEQVQSVLCFERHSGEQLWKTDVHRGGLPASLGHRKSTHATCTVACDGERLFVAFLNDEAIQATALDLEGNQLWQQTVGEFVSGFGYAPSPVVYKSLVILAADHKGGGFLAALDRGTGEIRWRKARPHAATYSSPAIAPVADRDQLLISGADLVAAYDPNTGDELWTSPGTTEATCGTMAFEGDLVFASGGYPKSETLCVRADGSGEVLWRNNQKSYVPSLLAHEGYLYQVTDNGIAYCWEAETGEQAWRSRLGGQFSASPVLAGGHIYVSNENGTTWVFKANPENFEKVAENQLGDETFATPTISGGQIFLRVADSSSGNRQETLYCIGPTAAE